MAPKRATAKKSSTATATTPAKLDTLGAGATETEDTSTPSSKAAAGETDVGEAVSPTAKKRRTTKTPPSPAKTVRGSKKKREGEVKAEDKKEATAAEPAAETAKAAGAEASSSAATTTEAVLPRADKEGGVAQGLEQSRGKATSKAATETADAKESDIIQTLERGHLYFAYRPKVDVHDNVHDYSDVQRFYLMIEPTQTTTDQQNKVLARRILEQRFEGLKPGKTFREAQPEIPVKVPGGEPLLKGQDDDCPPGDAPVGIWRELVMTSKKLAAHGSLRSGRHWSFTDTVGKREEVLAHLGYEEYSTKTRGERHFHSVRFNALAVYKLILHKAEGHTHIVYEMVEPEKPGPAQEAFNILQEGSLLVQSFTCRSRIPKIKIEGRPALQESKRAKLPDHLQKLFVGKLKQQLRFIPCNPPEFLNYPGIELLWIGVTKRLDQEFGEKFDEALDEETEEERNHYERHIEELLKGMEDQISHKPIHTGELE